MVLTVLPRHEPQDVFWLLHFSKIVFFFQRCCENRQRGSCLSIALIRILVIFPCFTKVLLSGFVVCKHLIVISPVLGSSATGAGVKYLFSLCSHFLPTHPFIQNAALHPRVFYLCRCLWTRCFKDGKKPPRDLVRECIVYHRHRPHDHVGLHIKHVCISPLNGLFYDAQSFKAPNKSCFLWSQPLVWAFYSKPRWWHFRQRCL